MARVDVCRPILHENCISTFRLISSLLLSAWSHLWCITGHHLRDTADVEQEQWSMPEGTGQVCKHLPRNISSYYPYTEPQANPGSDYATIPYWDKFSKPINCHYNCWSNSWWMFSSIWNCFLLIYQQRLVTVIESCSIDLIYMNMRDIGLVYSYI